MSISELYSKCMNYPNDVFNYLSKEQLLDVLNINDSLKQICSQVKDLKSDKKNCEKLLKNFKIKKIDFINRYLKNVEPKNYETEIYNIFNILMNINKHIKDFNHKIYCLQDKRNSLLTNKNNNNWNSDIYNLENKNKVKDIAIKYQASAWTGAGKVYSPYYRQVHYRSFFEKSTQ